MSDLPQIEIQFHGPGYEPEQDEARLTTQLAKVKYILQDGEMHTLPELAERTGGLSTALSARIRQLRKIGERTGAFIIPKPVRLDGGLRGYQMLPGPGHCLTRAP